MTGHHSLFPDIEPVAREAERAPEAEQEAPAYVDDRQLDLFSDLAVLRRELELLVMEGDFDAARRARDRALETFGTDGLAAEFDFLDVLRPELWSQPPGAVLERWQEVDARLAGRPGLRVGVRDAVFRRLLDRHKAATLARQRPGLVGPLCAAFGTIFGAASARAFVRDLLLEGRELDAGDFGHDAAVADLLGEHLSPVWLACLGALRRIWPVPAASPAELDSFGARPLATPASDEAAAREFWRCLCVARAREPAVPVLHEARRRMKILNPELHALHMRAAGVERP